jgi:hypothetical protein
LEKKRHHVDEHGTKPYQMRPFPWVKREMLGLAQP